MGLLIAGEEPDDIRVGSEAVLRVYAGSELLWDYENAAGRATILPPKLFLGLFARVPGRSILPILPRRTISVAARLPVVTARRAVTISVPRRTISVAPRIPADIIDLRATTIYPPRLTASLSPRLPVVTPRRAVSVAVPRRTVSVTPRVPAVSILYSVDVVVPRRTVAVIPRVPTVTATKAASVAVPRLTLLLGGRLPVVDAKRTVAVDTPKAALSLTPYVPEIITSPPRQAAGLSFTVTATNLTQSVWQDLDGGNFNWVVRSGYPNSLQSPNSRMKVIGTGAYNLSYQIRFGGSGTYTRGGRIMLLRGGTTTVLHQTLANQASVVRTSGIIPVTLQDNDILWMAGYCDHETSTSRRVNSTSDGTWYTIDPT